MALGGGVFLSENKTLPGAYINFVSAANASAGLSDRGTATLPLSLDWGGEGVMFTLEAADFYRDSLKVFGCPYTDEKLRAVREVFRNAKTVHFFRLNEGGAKAENAFARAKYPGEAGNLLRIVIKESEAGEGGGALYDVSTYLGSTLVDTQEAAASASELRDNGFVEWKAGASLLETAQTPLTGGTNGAMTDAAYGRYLDAAESVSFNVMGCTSDSRTVKELFAGFTRRMRDEAGKKFQCVVHDLLCDCEGVVSVKNTVKDGEAWALVPWVTGLSAGSGVNRSSDNRVYDGEYSVNAEYTQAELSAGIEEGSFMFHMSDGEVCVLRDINTFVSVTDEKSRDFSDNQVMRVLDQIANDIAVIFAKKYLGKVSNDKSGRISLWNDIVKHHRELERIRAIEDFDSEDVTVERGETKKSVAVTDRICPVCAMSQLYMTVYVM